MKVHGEVKMLRAQNLLARLRGLKMLRTERERRVSELFIKSCTLVHTWTMTRPIDIAFVDNNNKVVRVCRGVSPFRIVWGGRGARSVIERYSQEGDWYYIDHQVENCEISSRIVRRTSENVSRMCSKCR